MMQDVLVYEVTPCGHIKYLAGMTAPECPLCKDILRQGELVASLIYSNPFLSISAAREYSRKILEAELREDYITMHRLIQEALYGKESPHAA